MAGNFVGMGDRENVAAGKLTAAVTAGELINVGDQYGVALNDGEANAPNVMHTEGVWLLAKATGAGTGGSHGDKAQATGANLVTAGAGTYIGHFTEDVGDNDAVAQVKLLGHPA